MNIHIISTLTNGFRQYYIIYVILGKIIIMDDIFNLYKVDKNVIRYFTKLLIINNICDYSCISTKNKINNKVTILWLLKN